MNKLRALVFLVLFVCVSCSGYEVNTLDVEHKGVKVKKDEKGFCVDGTAVGEGKACIDLKKKDEPKPE